MIPIQVDRVEWGLIYPPKTPHKIGPVSFNQMGGRLSCNSCGREILIEQGYPPRAMLSCQCFVQEIMDETWVDEDVETHKERARKFRPVL